MPESWLDQPAFKLGSLLRRLTEAEVDFVIVGGVAVVLGGELRNDLDTDEVRRAQLTRGLVPQDRLQSRDRDRQLTEVGLAGSQQLKRYPSYAASRTMDLLVQGSPP